ncbi:MAG: helical backbone metal receptor [Steroidobacteraceae bacterium]|jgi:iron complex transport system substrate-binding protein
MIEPIGTLRVGATSRIFAAAALFAALCAASTASSDAPASPRPSEQPGIVLRDDSGREVRLAHPAQRIVSLLPSLTETVCALGACGRLLATDRYSDWPVEVRSLPKAGGLDDAQVEEIVRLRPDVVLISHSQRISDRLQELGVQSVALDTESFDAIAHAVTLIGDVLGVPDRAVALNGEIDRRVRTLSETATSRRNGRGASVYVEVDSTPYAAGADSFIGEMLARLGARNIVTRDLGPFPQLNPEYVVRHDPDVIIVTGAEVPRFADRPGWDRIRAVKEKRVCSFAPEVRYTIVRPGPRVADGMQALEACLERMAP